MPCCTESISVFSNETITTVTIPPQILAVSTTMPLVQVMYYYEGEYVLGGMFTLIKLGSVAGVPSVVVDHGGEASGYIKIK